MDKGFGAPFVRVYFRDGELAHTIEKFKYTYDEENPDECVITFRSDDPNILDMPEFQINAELRVVWGYIEGSSKSRKIYIQDVEPTFDREGITLTIKATDKAIELRKSNSHKLYKNGDALGIASGLADKHGLRAYIEVGPNNSISLSRLLGELKDPKKPNRRVSTPLDFLVGAIFLDSKREELRRAVNPANIIQGINVAADQTERSLQQASYILEESVGFNRGMAPTRILLSNYDDFVKELNAYRSQNRMPPEEFFRDNPYYTEIYLKALKAKLNQEDGENSPQAGRTDYQLLRDKLNSMDNTPYVVDTRDDELIIRKRNFNQTPYRKYSYMGPNGDLLSFSPMTKTKTKSSSSSAVGYGSWDSVNKEFNSSKVDASTSGSPTNLSTYTTGDLDRIIIPRVSMGREIGTNTPAVSTQVIKGLIIKKFSGETDDQFVKNMMGPRANSNSAQNVRDNSELKFNPGKVLVIGDPNIEVGQVFTFENVSKKYSGNYYSVKSIHDLDPNGGYYTNIEITRQGVNIKSKSNTISSKEARKSINKQLGVDNNSVRRRLKVERNKR